jgi:hypothetical protein
MMRTGLFGYAPPLACACAPDQGSRLAATVTAAASSVRRVPLFRAAAAGAEWKEGFMVVSRSSVRRVKGKKNAARGGQKEEPGF